MLKYFFSILTVCTIWASTCWGLSAERRLPTEQERESFGVPLASYLKDHFASKRIYGDATSFQKITKVEFCCVDEVQGEITYIVDLWFKARLYDHLRLDYDGYMVQRVYFTMDSLNEIRKDAKGFEIVESSDSIRTNDIVVREGWRTIVEKE